MLLDALAYPFRKGGWVLILLGAVFSAIIDFFGAVPVVGIGAALFGAGYFGAYYLHIVSTTMVGDDHPPEWPGFTDWLSDIISPFLRLTGIAILSFWPVAVVEFTLADSEAYDAAFLGAMVYGCIYLPMAVLAVQAHGGIGAALPHIVFPAIIRAMPLYLLAVAGLVGTQLLQGFGGEALEALPFVGWFLMAVLALYIIMFNGRLIGLIYRAKSEALGWE